MERFFILDKYNTWTDWNLILTAKDVTPPEPKTNLIELDGMDGTLDLSESLTGEVKYKDRTVSASFWTDYGNRKDRERLLRDIVTALHGRKIKIIEPDDPTHYFYGRVSIKGSTNNLAYLEFTLEAICEPWRYSVSDSVRRVDVSTEAIDVVINNNGVKTVRPTVRVHGNITITFDGIETSLTTGADYQDYVISSLKLSRGVNIVNVSGSGYATFMYKEADL